MSNFLINTPHLLLNYYEFYLNIQFGLTSLLFILHLDFFIIILIYQIIIEIQIKKSNIFFFIFNHMGLIIIFIIHLIFTQVLYFPNNFDKNSNENIYSLFFPSFAILCFFLNFILFFSRLSSILDNFLIYSTNYKSSSHKIFQNVIKIIAIILTDLLFHFIL